VLKCLGNAERDIPGDLDQRPEQGGVDAGRRVARVGAFGDVQALDGDGGIPTVPGRCRRRDETAGMVGVGAVVANDSVRPSSH
jgi:hypothetical protein